MRTKNRKRRRSPSLNTCKGGRHSRSKGRLQFTILSFQKVVSCRALSRRRNLKAIGFLASGARLIRNPETGPGEGSLTSQALLISHFWSPCPIFIPQYIHHSSLFCNQRQLLGYYLSNDELQQLKCKRTALFYIALKYQHNIKFGIFSNNLAHQLFLAIQSIWISISILSV